MQLKAGQIVTPSEQTKHGTPQDQWHYEQGQWCVLADIDLIEKAQEFINDGFLNPNNDASKECQFWMWLKANGLVAIVEEPTLVSITQVMDAVLTKPVEGPE